MQLVLPSKSFENSYIQYIEELGAEERYPFPMDFNHTDFDFLLERIRKFSVGMGLPDGYVSSSTWWLVHGNELVGVTNIRHCLNSALEYCGGHIGLGVRPSYRRKGVGNVLMQMSIAKLHEMGIGSIHIHCHKENTVSSRCIVTNGGTLDSEIIVDEKVVQRYLIKKPM